MTPKFVFGKEKNDWIKRPLLSNIEKILDYRGRTPKKLGLSWSDTGFLALSALNVKNGYIDFNADANYGDQELYNRWMGDNNLHKGQVVFTTEAPMGNVAQIPNDALYILSQRTIAFEVKHHLIREDFLATLLRSPKIFNELTSLSSGGTAKGISQKSLSNLKISLPASLDEQSAIGSLFRTLDDLLASYKDNLANYQSLKATMLSKMFPKAGKTIPEIRLERFEGEWEEKCIGEIADIVRGASPRPIQDPKWFDSNSEIGWLRISDVTSQNGRIHSLEQKISKLGQEKTRVLTEPHLLLSIAATVGKPVVNYVKTGVHDGFLIFMNPKFDREFMFQWLEMFREKWNRYGQPGSQVNLNSDIVKNQKILIPCMEEQKAIGAYFSNLDNLIVAHQEKISQLETLKKKLLQDMFI
ncbi:restriction endonuclease subunit S [Streptococcus thermophilus]|uniref:restriction endonuclease subunit S n=1 Tax=Streptococcus thermophilus TaxID=1308 RepID=UPI003A80FB04